MTDNVQTPLVSLINLCVGTGDGFVAASNTNFTDPVTTGKEVGRVTLTLNVTALSLEVATWDVNNIFDGSCLGINSSSDGVQIPLIRSKKDFCEPLNTFKSSRLPGTPYFGAIPHDEYCQSVHCDSQFLLVHECTKHPPSLTPG
ncbi:unannotated protein [freshwater metagenome]|uniref:Unannotated protein n=1 Tax=freshwater metagenome TaxID=449393 RepID=A0A6J6JDK0_9ZZZZ